MLGLLVKLSAITLPLMGVLTIHKQLLLGHLPPILPPTARSGWANEYDYIVVGAGSAGAVLANRLSEDQTISVLLLEAGGNENLISDIPIAYQLLQKSKLDWAYQTASQRHACYGLVGRSSFWPRGRVLGGTSVINVMLYTRGNPNDYDRWPAGWRWQDVFPYFLKSENNLDFDIATNGFHSQGRGYLDIRRTPFVSPLGRAFVESAHELGYPKLLDLNGPSQSGFAIPQTTNRNGARCSTSKAFLQPVYKRPNLHIITHAMVTQVGAGSPFLSAPVSAGVPNCSCVGHRHHHH
jgi:choline dehydrogenase-like flavoprotein